MTAILPENTTATDKSQAVGTEILKHLQEISKDLINPSSKTVPLNQEINAFLLQPAKGASLKTIKPLLRRHYGAHYSTERKSWSIPGSAKTDIENRFNRLGLDISFIPISDDYFRKTHKGKEAQDKWVRIDLLETKYYQEDEKLRIEKTKLQQEIDERQLDENEESILQKQQEFGDREALQITLKAEIDQLRKSAELLEKFDENNPIDGFLIEPGKTHLAAYKGIQILSNPECGIFQKFGQTVRIIKYQTEAKKKTSDRELVRPLDALTIDIVEEIFLIKILSEKQSWLKYDGREKDNKLIDFPDKAAKMILSEKGCGLPYLRGFVSCPTLREDGSLLEEPGYDEESGLYFNPCGTIFPKVPENPTWDEAKESLKLLKDLIKDFPFEDKVSLSVALAEIMTAVVRRSLDVAPPFANDASTRSSGKTLLAKLPSYIAIGKIFSMIVPVSNEEEMEKRFSAALLAGDQILCIDNVDFPFESTSLCAITTSSTWKTRILGLSKNIEVETNSQIIFTGNNLVFKGDLCSRFLKCRLLPDCEHPEERKFDRDLNEYTPKNRGILVAAILTIMRAYITAGSPGLNNLPAFREYSNWTKWIRAPLVWLGESDPYESAKEIKENDPEKDEIVALFSAWHEVIKKLPIEAITVNTLLKKVMDPEQRNSHDEIQALYDVLLTFAPNRAGGIDARLFGNKIRKCKDRILDGYRLTETGKDRTKAVLWKISKR